MVAFVAGLIGVAEGTLAYAALQIGASVLLSAAVNALSAKSAGATGRAQDVAQQLSVPSTAPVYRNVYGQTRAMGTPVITPVRGQMIFGCWILNSRPSDLMAPKVFLDKREVLAVTGDPFDFSGPGAVGTVYPFLGRMRFWIGRGDQTAPPAWYLTYAPWAAGPDEELWKASDKWQGRTVLWMQLDAGEPEKRQERWPAKPPLVEVEGRWSNVWDPRDAAQSPTNPATWAWSDNGALCILDALRQNPIQQYQLANLHMPSWTEAADVADEIVALASGGSQKRYRVAGTLTFANAEIEALVGPMVLSCAADLIRIGGQLGIAPGTWQMPITTVTDFASTSIDAVDLVQGDRLINQLLVSYLSPARGYETADLRPWSIPGALAADGGLPRPENLELTFCADPYQAMRVRKIIGLRLRRQETITAALWPQHYDLVGGSTATLALPAPFNAFDGFYEVQSIHPAANSLGEDGSMAMVLPVAIIKTSSAIYAWTPATDEEVVVDEPYDSARRGVQMPGTITATTGPGVDLDTGGTVIPRIRFAFAPSTTPDAATYEWDFRQGAGDWTPGGSIPANIRDGVSKVFGFLPIAPALFYDIRVRTLAPAGASDYRQITGVSAAFAVSGGAAVARLGSVRFTGTAPASGNMRGFVAYRTTTAVFNDSSPVSGLVLVSPGAAYTVDAGDPAIANLLTNPGFASGSTGWTLGTGWSVAAGKATHAAGASGTLDQALTIASGAAVRLGLTVSGRTAGSLDIRLVGTTVPDSVDAAANGVLADTLTAPAAMTLFRASAAIAFDGSVDDLAAYVQTAACLTQGQAFYWLRPVSLTGLTGTPDGPYDLTVI